MFCDACLVALVPDQSFRACIVVGHGALVLADALCTASGSCNGAPRVLVASSKTRKPRSLEPRWQSCAPIAFGGHRVFTLLGTPQFRLHGAQPRNLVDCTSQGLHAWTSRRSGCAGHAGVHAAGQPGGACLRLDAWRCSPSAVLVPHSIVC